MECLLRPVARQNGTTSASTQAPGGCHRGKPLQNRRFALCLSTIVYWQWFTSI